MLLWDSSRIQGYRVMDLGVLGAGGPGSWGSCLGNTFQQKLNMDKEEMEQATFLNIMHLEKKPLNVELTTTTNAGFRNPSEPTK